MVPVLGLVCVPVCSNPTKATERSNVCKVHVTGVLHHGYESTAGCYVTNPSGESLWTCSMSNNFTDCRTFYAHSTQSSELLPVVAGDEEYTKCRRTGEDVLRDQSRVPKNSDYQATVLLESIVKRLASLPPEKRPKKFCLQMDNTASDCKNKYMVALGCWLVHVGVFEEVYYGFLLVAHTHEDVDQMFSQFSRWLKRNNVLTFEDFLAGLGTLYHNSRVREVLRQRGDPEEEIQRKSECRVYEVEHVLALQNFLKPHINKKLKFLAVCSNLHSTCSLANMFSCFFFTVCPLSITSGLQAVPICA